MDRSCRLKGYSHWMHVLLLLSSLAGITVAANGQTNAANPAGNDKAHRPPATPQALQKGVHWSSSPIPQSVAVAFSFSERCLQDSCGDGAWGASVNRDSQSAIDSSANTCEANTTRKGSCGSSNGGRYFVQCKPGGAPKWAALAIYDDGTESLTDGEAIGYLTRDAAGQAAIANCNHDGCHVVWSEVICKGDLETKAGDCGSDPGTSWASNTYISGMGLTAVLTVQPINGGIILHGENSKTGVGGDYTILFDSIARLVPNSTSNIIVGSGNFAGHTHVSSFTRDWAENSITLDSRDQATADAVKQYFQYHSCTKR